MIRKLFVVANDNGYEPRHGHCLVSAADTKHFLPARVRLAVLTEEGKTETGVAGTWPQKLTHLSTMKS